jgi:hypothetical protein
MLHDVLKRLLAQVDAIILLEQTTRLLERVPGI